MVKMNESDKNSMLDMVKDERETYAAKMWGALMAPESEYFKIVSECSLEGRIIGAAHAGKRAAQSNQYCYLGMTETAMYFVIINSFDVKRIKGVIKVSYDEIKRTEIKGSFIPGRKVVYIFTEKENFKLSLMSSAIGTDIQGQKKAVRYLCNYFQ